MEFIGWIRQVRAKEKWKSQKEIKCILGDKIAQK